jgi:dolichol-phosphate mannosyltransferase
LRALASGNEDVVAVRLSRNHGHQLALTAGLSICRGERVLIIDADLQDPPELLPEMMRVMDGGADVVYGQREARRGESAFKRATAGAFYRVLERLTDVPIPRDTGDFRLVSRRALDVLLVMPEQHRFVRGMVSWIGFRQVPLRYVRDPRATGETKYPLRRMLRFAADAITSFSVRPLRLSAYAGALCAFASLGLLLFTVVAWRNDRTVRGWASLMCVVLLLGAVQLLVLGMIGEYLGRLFLEAKRRPLFVVDEVLRGREGGPSVDALATPGPFTAGAPSPRADGTAASHSVVTATEP